VRGSRRIIRSAGFSAKKPSLDALEHRCFYATTKQNACRLKAAGVFLFNSSFRFGLIFNNRNVGGAFHQRNTI